MLALDVAVGHAYGSAHTQEARLAWWDKFEDVLEQRAQWSSHNWRRGEKWRRREGNGSAGMGKTRQRV